MDLYLQIALSFPTVLFSVLLLVSIGYWLIAMLGLIDFDAFALGGEVDGGDSAEVGLFAGLLLKFGLDGLPLTVILTGVALFGWVISYFADYFLLRHLPWDALHYLFGAGVMIGAFLLALPLTGLLLRPLQRLFRKLKPVDADSLIGRVAVVRSPVVTLEQGSAALEDGGAGLILHVRAEPGLFSRGDNVVLVEYLDAQNAYRIISNHVRPPATGSP